MSAINLRSRNKSVIKENYDLLYHLVDKNSDSKAYETVDTLEKNIREFKNSRGQKYNGMSMIFGDMRYALTHYTRNDFRQQEMYRLLETLSLKLSESYTEGTLKEKLSNIYLELKDDFNIMCSTGSPSDLEALTDDFIMLQKLAPEMRDRGTFIFNRYDLMMANAGKCQATLPKLMPQLKDNRYVVNKDAINSITNDFQMLYSSINQVITSLDAPEKTDSDGIIKERVEDLDEDQEKALKAELRGLLKENWVVKEIARHKNMSIDEVTDLLDLD